VSALTRVLAKARDDAALFAGEFPGEVLGVSDDWDAQAWDVSARELGLSDSVAQQYWPRYSDELAAEIRRLARVAS
jgi:hypothetical protein